MCRIGGYRHSKTLPQFPSETLERVWGWVFPASYAECEGSTVVLSCSKAENANLLSMIIEKLCPRFAKLPGTLGSL